MKGRFIQFAAVVLAFAFTACSDKENEFVPDEQAADMVVYGTIYTVEDDAPQAEAFAVKDGKYIYM